MADNVPKDPGATPLISLAKYTSIDFSCLAPSVPLTKAVIPINLAAPFGISNEVQSERTSPVATVPQLVN